METTNKPLPPIALCIILDLIGCASFSIPLVGEFSDVIWAPISAFLFYKMFGGRFGMFGAALNFVEELFPFTDIIPSFTIAWVMKYYTSGKIKGSAVETKNHHLIKP